MPNSNADSQGLQPSVQLLLSWDSLEPRSVSSTRSAACRRKKPRVYRLSPVGFQKRWSPRLSVCSWPCRRYGHTTGSPTKLKHSALDDELLIRIDRLLH